MSRFFAPRGLFATIFLWFFAAQLLIGVALYALAATTERQFDRGTTEMAGGSIEARAQATAIAYELGGLDAARRAWRTPAAPDGARNTDGPRGPEDRSSAALYVVPGEGAPRLLAGAPAPIAAAQLRAALRERETLIPGGRDGQWLVRRVQTGKATYLALIRLRERGGPPRGFIGGFFGGRPTQGGPEGGPLRGNLARWAVIALVMGAVCFGLARYLTAPALQLSRAARRFAQGDLSARVGPQLKHRRDELAELGRDFDLMAHSIETQRAGERRLLGDISHELRSPLARLQVALDLAEQGAGAQTRGYLTRIEEEVEELGELIGQLLTLTRLENAGAELAQTEIELSDLVADVCADADFEASASGRTVELSENQAATVRGNAALLHSAIENVVRNALLHAPQSARVQVSLQTSASEAIIRVRDWGQGAPEDALEELFRPFYRVAQARDRQSGGTGLGLSITQRALKSHGGNARARNAPEGGLEVEMRLPLAQKPARP